MAYLGGALSSVPVYQPLPMIVTGTLAVGVVPIYIPTDANYQILGVQAVVFTPSVGSPIVADLLVNGTSVFTTTANRPTIPAGVNSSTVTVPDTVNVTAGSLLSLSILSVGSTSPGAGLTVAVSMERTSA